MALYPVTLATILPGDQSFLVVAAAGATTGATRIDTMGGTIRPMVAKSAYGASDSAWIRDIANKYRVDATFTCAEDATTLESLLVLAARVDVYVKRSSNSITYDKIANALFEAQPKNIPEDGTAHRTIELSFGGGVYTTGVAAASVPTYT